MVARCPRFRILPGPWIAPTSSSLRSGRTPPRTTSVRRRASVERTATSDFVILPPATPSTRSVRSSSLESISASFIRRKVSVPVRTPGPVRWAEAMELDSWGRTPSHPHHLVSEKKASARNAGRALSSDSVRGLRRSTPTQDLPPNERDSTPKCEKRGLGHQGAVPASA
jgi:hypothetical protein